MFQVYLNKATGFVKDNQRTLIKVGMTVGGAVIGALASGVVNGMLEEDFESDVMAAAQEETLADSASE